MSERSMWQSATRWKPSSSKALPRSVASDSTWMSTGSKVPHLFAVSSQVVQKETYSPAGRPRRDSSRYGSRVPAPCRGLLTQKVSPKGRSGQRRPGLCPSLAIHAIPCATRLILNPGARSGPGRGRSWCSDDRVTPPGSRPRDRPRCLGLLPGRLDPSSSAPASQAGSTGRSAP